MITNYQRKLPNKQAERAELESIYETNLNSIETETPIARAFAGIPSGDPLLEVDLVRRRQRVVGESTPFEGSK